MEASHQSGVSRLFNSLLAAICLAPLLLLVTTFILGFNEKRDVCDSRAIDAGVDHLMKVSCTNNLEADGKLVFFNCDLTAAELDIGSISLGDFAGKLPSIMTSTGLTIESSMKQCVEKTSSSTSKDKGGGGGKTTVTTYSYQTEWSSTAIDSSSFKYKNDPTTGWKENCGKENPTWPPNLPSSTTKYAPTAKVGAYEISGSYVSTIPLSEPALESADAPVGWTSTGCEGGADFCKKGNHQHHHGIGDVRISFKKTNWHAPGMSVLGENNKGKISRWVAPDSWMCSGTQIGQLRVGTIDKDTFMKDLEAAAGAVTWLLRIVGFCLAWFAFSLMAKPLGVAADCIPCVGPCLGDMIEAVACAISICPACACTMMVAGFVWIFMRPMKGIPLLLGSILIFGGFAFFKMRKGQKEQRTIELKGELMA